MSSDKQTRGLSLFACTFQWREALAQYICEIFFTDKKVETAGYTDISIALSSKDQEVYRKWRNNRPGYLLYFLTLNSAGALIKFCTNQGNLVRPE